MFHSSLYSSLYPHLESLKSFVVILHRKQNFTTCSSYFPLLLIFIVVFSSLHILMMLVFLLHYAHILSDQSVVRVILLSRRYHPRSVENAMSYYLQVYIIIWHFHTNPVQY